jgi:hypothetical protein
VLLNILAISFISIPFLSENRRLRDDAMTKQLNCWVIGVKTEKILPKNGGDWIARSSRAMTDGLDLP